MEYRLFCAFVLPRPDHAALLHVSDLKNQLVLSDSRMKPEVEMVRQNIKVKLVIGDCGPSSMGLCRTARDLDKALGSCKSLVALDSCKSLVKSCYWICGQ